MSLMVSVGVTVSLLLLMLTGRCGAQGCTLGDIQAIQPDINFPLEKADGLWHILKVHGLPDASQFKWYSVDVVPTPTGLALYTNIRDASDSCSYPAMEVNSLDNGYVFVGEETPGSGLQFQSMVVAAVDEEVQHMLAYLCVTALGSAGDPCTFPVVLLAGRQYDPSAASQWLTSLTSSSLPCYNDTQSITIPQGERCPLNQMVELPGRNCVVANFPVQSNFDLSEYVSGPWKEMAWLAPAYIPESEFYQDYVHVYTIQPDGNILCDVSARNPQDDNKCLFYQLNISVTSTPGKLILHEPAKGSVPYNVIHVDYDHYALVFGCATLDPATGKCEMGRGWLWSRHVTLERQYRLEANAIITNLCVNPAAWFSTKHEEPCTSGADGNSYKRIVAAMIAMFLGFVLIMT